MKPGRYNLSHQAGYAAVHYSYDEFDKAYGFAFVDGKKRPEYVTWSLDGKSHAGRNWNVDLDSWVAL